MSGHSKWHNIRLKKQKVDLVRGKLFSKLAREIAVVAKAGGGEGATFETILYEGYAPGGVAVLVEVLTDNRNRAASDIRNLFTRYGGSLDGSGSVSWMFDRQGIITVDRSKAKEDDVLSTALEAGAEDIRTSGDVYEIVTSPEQFFKVKQAVERARLPLESADITMVPKSTVRVEGKDAQHVLRLMEALEEHDDVQHAYANFDIPDEILQQVG